LLNFCTGASLIEDLIIYFTETTDRFIHSSMFSQLTTKGTLCPGWGIETALADEIAKELKDRMLSRGDTAQLQLSEKALQRANEINHKIDLITEHLKSNPPVPMEVSDR
jgi:hypothetical protein